MKSSNRNLFKYLVVILSISALITVSFVLYKSVYLPRSALAMLPNPDLTEIEPQVAEELRNRRIAVEKNLDSAEAWGKLGMVLDIHNFKQESIPSLFEKAAVNTIIYANYYGHTPLRLILAHIKVKNVVWIIFGRHLIVFYDVGGSESRHEFGRFKNVSSLPFKFFWDQNRIDDVFCSEQRDSDWRLGREAFHIRNRA